MRAELLVCNPVRENCYVVWDEATLSAAVIDAGMSCPSEEEALRRLVEARGLRLRLSLQTHMHFDHVWGLPFLHREYGLRPLCHEADEALYYAAPAMARRFGLGMDPALPAPERLLSDGEELRLGELALRVIHTPGHTPGGVCYYAEDEGVLFSGDTLFMGSVGRADLPGGDMDAELESVRSRLLTLSADTLVRPGHGPDTTVAQERRNFL